MMTVTGTAVDFVTGAPLVGFTVSVGAYPNPSTCVTAQTATSNPCGAPVSPVTTTTSATGAFSVTVPSGSAMLVIAPATANAYATLHKGVLAGATSLGTLKLTALTADQQGWIADLNAQRAAAAVPTSYPNLIVDEYATEQAQAYQTAGLAANSLTDAGWTPYFNAWSSAAGLNLYSPAGVLSTVPNPSPYAFTFGSAASGLVTQPAGSPGYALSDSAWLWGDKSNCTAPYDWNSTTQCPFATTGHYSILSSTNDVWVGLGEAGPDPNESGQYDYGILVVQI